MRIGRRSTADRAVAGQARDVSVFTAQVVTTGEGGMYDNDANLAQRMRRLRNHGVTLGRFFTFVEPGFNYRLSEITAAIGLAQFGASMRYSPIAEFG